MSGTLLRWQLLRQFSSFPWSIELRRLTFVEPFSPILATFRASLRLTPSKSPALTFWRRQKVTEYAFGWSARFRSFGFVPNRSTRTSRRSCSKSMGRLYQARSLAPSQRICAERSWSSEPRTSGTKDINDVYAGPSTSKPLQPDRIVQRPSAPALRQ